MGHEIHQGHSHQHGISAATRLSCTMGISVSFTMPHALCAWRSCGRAQAGSDSNNPAKCSSGHSCSGHEATHKHGPGCGHEAVPHGDHTDYSSLVISTICMRAIATTTVRFSLPLPQGGDGSFAVFTCRPRLYRHLARRTASSSTPEPGHDRCDNSVIEVKGANEAQRVRS